MKQADPSGWVLHAPCKISAQRYRLLRDYSLQFGSALLLGSVTGFEWQGLNCFTRIFQRSRRFLLAGRKGWIWNSITLAIGMLAASEVLGSAVRGIIAESVLDLLSIRPGRGNIRHTEKLYRSGRTLSYTVIF